MILGYIMVHFILHYLYPLINTCVNKQTNVNNYNKNLERIMLITTKVHKVNEINNNKSVKLYISTPVGGNKA